MSAASSPAGRTAMIRRRLAIPLSALAVTTLVTAWAEIFWGGVVRVTGSGLGHRHSYHLASRWMTVPWLLASSPVSKK